MRPRLRAVRPGPRARQAVNLVNGSTLAGLGVAALGGARLARGADGLFVGTGYRLPVPPAPAFCLGNVIITRHDAIVPGSPLWRHEARHATQFAWCGGVVMVPLYLTAAGLSWLLTGDFGSRNAFERLAGLADGGYTDKPLRPALRLASRRAAARAAGGRPRRRAVVPRRRVAVPRRPAIRRRVAAPRRRPDQDPSSILATMTTNSDERS
jgi:hypothetical protein